MIAFVLAGIAEDMLGEANNASVLFLISGIAGDELGVVTSALVLDAKDVF